MEKKKKKIQHPIAFGLSLFWSIMIAAIWISSAIGSSHISPKTSFCSKVDLVATRCECDYGDCGNDATTLVYTQWNVPNNVWPNKSYRLSGTTYGKTETYLAPKKDTYLVPDENGFKVETERGWEEKTYTDGSYTRTEISGYYCAEHTEAGENLILSGIRHARMRSNVFGKTVVVIVTMFPWLWMLIGNMRAKRKAAKAQKSSTNSKV